MVYSKKEIKLLIEDYFNEFSIINIALNNKDLLEKLKSGKLKIGPLKNFFQYSKTKVEDFPGEVLKDIGILNNIVDELNIILINKELLQDINRIKKLYNKARKIIYER